MDWIEVAQFPRPTPEESRGGFIASRTSRAFTAVLLVTALASVWCAGSLAARSDLQMEWWQWFLTALPVVAVSLVAHESLHLAMHPAWGLSRRSKCGLANVHGVPALWVGFAGWVSRPRAIGILVAPFLVLGVGAAVGALSSDPGIGSYLLCVASVNTLASRSDLHFAAALYRSSAVEVHEATNGYYIR